MSVNVFSTKVLIGDTIFTSPTGGGTAISTWSSEPREVPAVCSAKAVPSFLSYFKTLSIGPAPGIEPTTSRSAVKRSTDWASPAAVKDMFFHRWSHFCDEISDPRFQKRDIFWSLVPQKWYSLIPDPSRNCWSRSHGLWSLIPVL